MMEDWKRQRIKGQLQMEVRAAVTKAKDLGLTTDDIMEVMRVESHARVIETGMSFALWNVKD